MTTAPPAERQSLTALVFGASGITGYGILHALLASPSFARIIALTNRPLSTANAHLPPDQRLELFSGIDLLNREQSLAQLQSIPGIQGVTHVYYAAYGAHGKGWEEVKGVNAEMLINAVGGVEVCCAGVEFVSLNTGGKAYGVEFVGQEGVNYDTPLKESAPRILEPFASKVFYYAQYDILKRASAGKRWTFCEVRPDAIIGFVPQNNAMNLAQALGLYLSLYRELKGEGAEVQFPYGREAWEALHTDSSADLLGRFHIYASLHPDAVSERAFNVVDSQAFAWRDLWPSIAAYFGLRGTGPGSAALGKLAITDWMHEHRGEWNGFVAKRGLKEGALEATGFDFADSVMQIPFRRDMDSTARIEAGFAEQRQPFEGYRKAFDDMRRARIIP